MSAPPTDDLLPVSGDAGHELTARALITGVLLGGLLSVCNVYLGLQLGFGVGMSIAGAVLGYGVWTGLQGVSGGRIRAWGMLENNINQTACSSGAAVASAGLVASIPALTLVTGRVLPWYWLALWVFSVCLVGIVVALGLRRQMLDVSQLRFPSGVASATLIRELHTRGRDAVRRVLMMVAAAIVASGYGIWAFLRSFSALPIPGNVAGYSLSNLGIALNPSPLFIGIGGLVGLRTAASLLAGSVLAYAVVAPPLLRSQTIELTTSASLERLPAGVALARTGQSGLQYDATRGRLQWTGVMTTDERDRLQQQSPSAAYLHAVDTLFKGSQPGAARPSFGQLRNWMVWPAAVLMVIASLVSAVLAWRSARAAIGDLRGGSRCASDVTRTTYVVLLLIALVLSAGLQSLLFGIPIWAGAMAVVVTFALALVAARVTGESGITPVGQMGKVSQLTFGALLPAQPAANLMAANVTGGAASQCGDLLHDFKCGRMLGAAPRAQAFAQICGALVGAVVGSLAYCLLVPDPQQQLLTAKMPAPAVATIKAVAELFQYGFAALPRGTVTAMCGAAAVGLTLPLLERFLPRRVGVFLPSAASLGFGFVLPVSVTLTIFIGGLLATVLQRLVGENRRQVLIVVWTGLIAGATLTRFGVAVARAA